MTWARIVHADEQWIVSKWYHTIAVTLASLSEKLSKEITHQKETVLF